MIINMSRKIYCVDCNCFLGELMGGTVIKKETSFRCSSCEMEVQTFQTLNKFKNIGENYKDNYNDKNNFNDLFGSLFGGKL